MTITKGHIKGNISDEYNISSNLGVIIHCTYIKHNYGCAFVHTYVCHIYIYTYTHICGSIRETG